MAEVGRMYCLVGYATATTFPRERILMDASILALACNQSVAVRYSVTRYRIIVMLFRRWRAKRHLENSREFYETVLMLNRQLRKMKA